MQLAKEGIDDKLQDIETLVSANEELNEQVKHFFATKDKMDNPEAQSAESKDIEEQEAADVKQVRHTCICEGK